jgi:hypothetical protein
MGSWLSALLVHVAHWTILRRALVAAPLHALLPRAASVEHLADLAVVDALAAKAEDGLVAWTDIPLRMRRAHCAAFCGSPGGAGSGRLFGVRVPATALALEPAPSEGDTSRLRDGVVISTVLMGSQPNVRARIASVLSKNTAAVPSRHWVSVIPVYQDDSHSFTYPPAAPVAVGLDLQVAGYHRLQTVLAADAAGLVQNVSKLAFPSTETTPTLGVEVEFCEGRQMRFAVAAEKRWALAQALREIARSPASNVEEELLESLLGKSNWCFLVRRVLLGVWEVVYKALHSPNRPEGLVILTPRLRKELWLAAALLPLAEEHSAPFHDTLTLFDASGKSSRGNGGFGVAYKRGVTEAMATELTTSIETECGRLPLFKVLPGHVVPAARAHSASARAASAFLAFDWETPGAAGWRAARHGEFRVPLRHVTVGEIVTGGMALRSAARAKGAFATLLPIGGDNQPSLSALMKGRSSIRDMNRVCRIVGARSIFYGVRAKWFWVPSKANSSDGPSRWWSTRYNGGKMRVFDVPAY